LYAHFPFTVSDRGTVIAGDAQERHLLYLDPEGNLITKVGTQGQGPSEFQDIAVVQWYRNEQCVRVTDFGNRRYSRWNEKGKFIDEISFPGDLIFDFWFLNQKAMITSKDIAGHFEGHPRLVKISLADKKETQLWEHMLPKNKQVTSATVEGRTMARLLQWDPKIVFAVGSNYIAVIWGEDQKIHLIDFEGKPLAKPFPCGLPQTPVTREDENRQIMEFPAEWREVLGKNMVRYEYWPSVNQMTVDPKDRLWVFGFHKGEDQPYPLRVYDRNGNLLAEGKVANLPSAILEDSLYYTIEQEDGVILNKVSFSL
jgi:hypothetical protein